MKKDKNKTRVRASGVWDETSYVTCEPDFPQSPSESEIQLSRIIETRDLTMITSPKLVVPHQGFGPWVKEGLISIFLPVGFPDSVTEDFVRFL